MKWYKQSNDVPVSVNSTREYIQYKSSPTVPACYYICNEGYSNEKKLSRFDLLVTDWNPIDKILSGKLSADGFVDEEAEIYVESFGFPFEENTQYVVRFFPAGVDVEPHLSGTEFQKIIGLVEASLGK